MEAYRGYYHVMQGIVFYKLRNRKGLGSGPLENYQTTSERPFG